MAFVTDTATPARTVVVVDDDRDFLRGLERLLRACGYDPRTFNSAATFPAGEPIADAYCVIIDIHLDGASGFDLQRQLTACGSTTPVIFMSAFDDEATQAAVMRSGVTAFLHKPFSAHALIDAIENAR
jgi:FixJ family two-component response regulator